MIIDINANKVLCKWFFTIYDIQYIYYLSYKLKAIIFQFFQKRKNNFKVINKQLDS